MFVLGVDPGLTRCGFGLVQRASATPYFEVLAAGLLETSLEQPMEQRLATLHGDIAALLDDTKPDVVAIERIFSQANVKSVVSVAQASGFVLALATIRNIPIAQYSPNEVKLNVAGSGSADKHDVQDMVARLCGLEIALSPPDVADAIAVAICHLSASPLLAAINGGES
jgi:crossover junction endodeoxyribonuclease RuvC